MNLFKNFLEIAYDKRQKREKRYWRHWAFIEIHDHLWIVIRNDMEYPLSYSNLWKYLIDRELTFFWLTQTNLTIYRIVLRNLQIPVPSRGTEVQFTYKVLQSIFDQTGHCFKSWIVQKMLSELLPQWEFRAYYFKGKIYF